MISSPSNGFEEDREAVARVLRRMRLEPITMGELGAAPQTPARQSLAWVAEADAVIVLMGIEQGSKPPDSEKTFSQLEYEKADPDRIFIYVKRIPGKKIEECVGAEWQRKALEVHVASMYSSTLELAAHVAADLFRCFRSIPGFLSRGERALGYAIVTGVWLHFMWSLLKSWDPRPFIALGKLVTVLLLGGGLTIGVSKQCVPAPTPIDLSVSLSPEALETFDALVARGECRPCHDWTKAPRSWSKCILCPPGWDLDATTIMSPSPVCVRRNAIDAIKVDSMLDIIEADPENPELRHAVPANVVERDVRKAFEACGNHRLCNGVDISFYAFSVTEHEIGCGGEPQPRTSTVAPPGPPRMVRFAAVSGTELCMEAQLQSAKWPGDVRAKVELGEPERKPCEDVHCLSLARWLRKEPSDRRE